MCAQDNERRPLRRLALHKPLLLGDRCARRFSCLGAASQRPRPASNLVLSAPAVVPPSGPPRAHPPSAPDRMLTPPRRWAPARRGQAAFARLGSDPCCRPGRLARARGQPCQPLRDVLQKVPPIPAREPLQRAASCDPGRQRRVRLAPGYACCAASACQRAALSSTVLIRWSVCAAVCARTPATLASGTGRWSPAARSRTSG